jgi:hypothetical protein
LEKLLIDVFDPQDGELATVVVDLPHGSIKATDDWEKRRQMAERWRAALEELGAKRGFRVGPILTYPATGSHNSDLPEKGCLGTEEVPLRETLRASTLVIAMTEFSATAPLVLLAAENDDFRAASMPGVEERMESTALAADYARVARRCRSVAEAMQGAVLCDVIFSTGHRCWFDLRHREPEMDDGLLPRFKKGVRLINLPSGETYSVPYEVEVKGAPSWTAGTIPVVEEGELVLFHLANNRIQLVEGEGPVAQRYRDCFASDPARTNVAEVAFGVNDRAEVTGNGLEDEKAGFHWAYGRSDHLGGVVGVSEFRSQETVVHQDLIYARGNPVQVTQASLHHPDGRSISVILGAQYQM